MCSPTSLHNQHNNQMASKNRESQKAEQRARKERQMKDNSGKSKYALNAEARKKAAKAGI